MTAWLQTGVMRAVSALVVFLALNTQLNVATAWSQEALALYDLVEEVRCSLQLIGIEGPDINLAIELVSHCKY